MKNKILALFVALLLVSCFVSASGKGANVSDESRGNSEMRGNLDIKEMDSVPAIPVANVFAEVKNRFRVAGEKFNVAMDNWEAAKNRYRNEKSEDALKFALDKGRDTLECNVEKVVEHLNLVKSKVEDDLKIDEAVKSRIVSEINMRIFDFDNRVREMQRVESKDELNKFNFDISADRKMAVPVMNNALNRIKNSKIESAILKVDDIKKKVVAEAKNLKDEGADVSFVENLLNDASVDIEKAKIVFAEIDIKLFELDKIGESSDVLKSLNEKSKNANKHVKSSVEILKNAFQELKRVRFMEMKSENRADIFVDEDIVDEDVEV